MAEEEFQSISLVQYKGQVYIISSQIFFRKITSPDELQAIRFFSVHTKADHPRAQLSVRPQGSKQAFNHNLYPILLKSTLKHLAGEWKSCIITRL